MALGEAAGAPLVYGPTLDTAVNLAANFYDLGRLSGNIPIIFEFRYDFNESSFYMVGYPQE
jgi:hypothetical protein